MYCSHCGAQNSDDARFCSRCGNPLSTAGMEAGTPSGESEPRITAPSEAKMGEGQVSESEETLPSPPESSIPPTNVQPWTSTGYPYYPSYGATRTDGLCVAGMVLGIIGLVLFWIPYLAIPCGILGIILGSIGIKNVQNEPQLKTGQGMGVAGLVTGILALVGGIVMIVIYASITTWWSW